MGDVHYQILATASSTPHSRYFLALEGLPHRADVAAAIEALTSEQIGVTVKYWKVPQTDTEERRGKQVLAKDFNANFDSLVTTSKSGKPLLVAEVELHFPENTYGS